MARAPRGYVHPASSVTSYKPGDGHAGVDRDFDDEQPGDTATAREWVSIGEGSLMRRPHAGCD